MQETANWKWETDSSGLQLTAKVEGVTHRFSEGTEELAYRGPFDVCPKHVAGAAKDITGKPVK